jgi:ATP-binding cassette, subfamily B (MDR/TAP), member 10
MSGVWFGSVGIAANLAMLSVLNYGGNLVIDNQLSVGELTSFLLYSVYVAFALSGTATFFTDFMKGVGASQRGCAHNSTLSNINAGTDPQRGILIGDCGI